MLTNLLTDLEWKVTYVGCAEDPSKDQVLEEVMVGPVLVGVNRFVLQAPAPNSAMIANEDIIGVTVVLVTCSYMEQEFVRIGYYVNNEYNGYDPENPPVEIDLTQLYRNILAERPIVTRVNIDWSGAADPNVIMSMTEYDEENANMVIDNEDSMDVDMMQQQQSEHMARLM